MAIVHRVPGIPALVLRRATGRVEGATKMATSDVHGGAGSSGPAGSRPTS